MALLIKDPGTVLGTGSQLVNGVEGVPFLVHHSSGTIKEPDGIFHLAWPGHMRWAHVAVPGHMMTRWAHAVGTGHLMKTMVEKA